MEKHPTFAKLRKSNKMEQIRAGVEAMQHDMARRNVEEAAEEKKIQKLFKIVFCLIILEFFTVVLALWNSH